jgi:crotonobetainyl-CoA:carnitine CoA-transferase CaiB-like acyl-CoA transferase
MSADHLAAPIPDAPLAGLRIVDASDYVSGPMAGMMLADLGAEVVKIERPGAGDLFRSYGLRREGIGAFWLNVNRGKSSVQLDLKDDTHRTSLRTLIGTADVLIQNWRPGVAAKLGLDADTLMGTNPRLIVLEITGYGSDGPRVAEPAFDGVLQAQSGVASAQGGDGDPVPVAAMLIDKVTAMLGVQAVLAALNQRWTTGRGARVELPMLNAAAYFNFPDIYQDRTFLDDERRLSTRLFSPIVATSDGAVCMVAVGGAHIKRICQAFDHEDWIPALKEHTDQNDLMFALMSQAAEAARSMTSAELLGRLQELDVAATLVLDRDAHLDDPQVRHNRVYVEVHDEALGAVRVARYPAAFDGRTYVAEFSAPPAGRDNDRLLPVTDGLQSVGAGVGHD